MRPGAAGAITFATLLAVYLLTLAPGLTFWDAGELIAAVETLGIPHPPGTPLWVLLARAWSDVLGFLPRALATNLLAAVAVSGACGVIAALLARWSGKLMCGIAAGVCAGAMSTVWLNATETETYALALLLAALMLFAGNRAGATGEWRWLALLGYLIALAVPLHLSAIVAAPAAIVLAARTDAGTIRWREGALLAAVLLGVAAVGTVNVGAMMLAAVAIIAVVTHAPRPGAALAIVLAAALGLSVLLFLPLRAVHEPWLNSQYPVDWNALWELVGRRQYGEHPLWPRRSPLWAQLGMLVQYADWQVALGIRPGIVPSIPRVFASAAFVALALGGARWHRALHRRSWLAMLVLLLSATLGLVAYMNFRAGPTFGHGLLPQGTGHEARERDYFFLFGFWIWGVWAGLGAVKLAARLRGPLWAGVLIAALPIPLNWRAVDRSREPEASLPLIVARALLEPAPAGAVLITGGDNDTYPAWYAQTVRGMRTDVLVIVSPMLNARWYRGEIGRRHGLMRPEVAARPALGELGALREIAELAQARERPLLFASTVDRSRRQAVDTEWTLAGGWFRRGAHDGERLAVIDAWADTVALQEFADRYDPRDRRPVPDSVDPTARVMAAWLSCPRRIVAHARGALPADSLATVCKL